MFEKKNNPFENNSDLKDYAISKLSDILRKIELLNSGLDKAADLTEQDFSSLNENIGESLNKSADVSDLSEEITGKIYGDTVKNCIKELKQVLVRIKNYVDETGIGFKEGQKELTNVNKTLGDIVDNLSGFKSLVKHLRMLGISTKIESVRLGLEDRGFYTLAEDVEKLSTMITKKSLDIRGKLTYLLNLTTKGKSTITSLIRTQNEFTSKIVGEALLSSDLLSDKYRSASEKSGLIVAKSKMISQATSRIDSTDEIYVTVKSQFENIKNVLSDLVSDSKKKFAEFLGSGSVSAKFITEFQNTLNLQCEHIENVVNNLDGAIQNLRTGFKNIEDNITSLMTELNQFIGSSSFGQNSLLTEISKKLTAVSNTIDQDSKISDEMVSSMASVADTIADLSGFVDEIDEIGTEVELIALNASVKAARTGEEGAALGVLAESIQKLSIDAKKQTSLILEVLQNVMKTAEKLRNNFNSKNTVENKENLASLSAKINELLGSLNDTDADISNKSEELIEQTAELNDQIKKIMQKVWTDKKVRNITEVYLNEFKKFAGSTLFTLAADYGNSTEANIIKHPAGDMNIYKNVRRETKPAKISSENKIPSNGSNGSINNNDIIY